MSPAQAECLEAGPERLGKILFLARSLDFGGAERQLAVLAAGLHARGHAVRVAVFYPGGGLEAGLRAAGVPIHAFEKRGRWDLLGFLQGLVRYLRAERPAIIHGYLTVPNLLAVILKPLVPGSRAVLGIRASDMDPLRYDRLSRLTMRLEALAAPRADLIIVNSHAGLRHQEMRGFPAERMRVIPNGIDTDRFRPDQDLRRQARADLGLSQHDQLLGLVARFDPMKDHATFLQAAARLASDHPDLRVLCLGGGEGDVREAVVRQARALGLGERLTISGPRNDMPAVYAALDLLVSSSRYGEGFSNAIGEAMAAGVPCAVTDVGDSAWIVGETGRVVPPGEPEALASALAELLALPLGDRIRLGAAARRRIQAHFSVPALLAATVAALAALREDR